MLSFVSNRGRDSLLKSEQTTHIYELFIPQFSFN